MSRVILYLSVLVIIITSCSKNDKMTFDAKPSIYFQLSDEHGQSEVDSLLYSFAMGTKTVDTVALNVRIMGEAADYDRYFKAEIVSELTTASEQIHYSLIADEYIVPAGAINSQLPVVLFNSDPLLRDSALSIGLEIIESEDFELGAKEKLVAKLIFSDKLVKPSTWNYLKYWFGDYNPTKHKISLELFGEDFPQTNQEYFQSYGKWATYGTYLNKYFIENYPYYDEDGVVIEPWL